MPNEKPKKLKLRWRARGNMEIYCPHCKEVIFKGHYAGFTWYSLEGKCPYCKKPVLDEWEEEK